MKLNWNNVKKLRSGHTVWRCMAVSDGTVHIHESLLSGKRILIPQRSLVDPKRLLEISRKIGSTVPGKGEYLNDIHGHGAEWIAAFTTRREALKFQADVHAGRLPDVTRAAAAWGKECRSWGGMFDDFDYDYGDWRDDYYQDPHTESMYNEGEL